MLLCPAKIFRSHLNPRNGGGLPKLGVLHIPDWYCFRLIASFAAHELGHCHLVHDCRRVSHNGGDAVAGVVQPANSLGKSTLFTHGGFNGSVRWI